ncbi:MAG: YCF48-related protein [Candidatus Uhrbacteria bacterium]|nr:YCF48-related protein [Candidatus Uhrbacteria bacterium]
MNMHQSSRGAVLVATLLLTGAGCFSGGSGTSAGGVWQSDDGGQSWTATNALPSATGVGSISETDIIAVEHDPEDASAVYIGTSSNGLLYSLDGGLVWMRPEDEEIRKGAVLAIEVDPTDVCTYYVLKTSRVAKTTDCGRSFNTESYVETQTDEDLTAMVLDWYNPKILWLGNSSGDVMRSSDSGKTWTTIERVNGDVTSIIVSNADSRIVMVGTRNKGMYRTIDSGATWTEFEDTLKDFKDSDKVLSFSQTNDGTTVIMNSDYGLLISDDSGATWSGVSLLTARGEVDILSAVVAPTNGDVIMYATSNTFYRSTSRGSAWETSEVPSGRSVGVITVNPANEEAVILGTVTPEE